MTNHILQSVLSTSGARFSELGGPGWGMD